ncbi:transient receptor potential channel pyrexia [Anabrus simplex]|uniref:transient receptor potential channel pyrexia n=1 Tax=Anabrus simplex TaxID=316456 RepID=UPI0035A3B49D
MTCKIYQSTETLSETSVCERSGQLMAAIEAGDVAAVEKALKRNGTDVNSTCGLMHVTALQQAASWGDNGLEMVKLLLQHGARADVTDKLGRGPLHHAAAVGGEEVMRLLLAAGAKPDIRFQVSSWQQKQGAQNYKLGDEGTACHQVEAGYNLPVPECWGRTPLHQAVKGNHPRCVQLLLDAGAYVDPQDERGLTPLLLAGAGVSPSDREAVEKYEQVVELLVSAGAKVMYCIPDTNMTPLHHAAMLRSVRATSILLDAGALPDADPGQETTPLHEAAGSGSAEVVRLLLDKGAPVNLPDKIGRTPLHKAAYCGARDVLAILLSHGGDLSAVTATDVSVVDAILCSMPRSINFFTDLMDNCVMTNSASVNDRDFKDVCSKTTLTFQIHLDFVPLCPNGQEQQMAVVSALMTGSNTLQEGLLFQHPLLQIFIRMKWSKLRSFFLVLVALQLSFVITLSTYVGLFVQEHINEHQLKYPQYILMVTSIGVLTYALGQLLLMPKHYLQEVETWLHLVSATLAITVAIQGEVHPRHVTIPSVNVTEPNIEIVEIPQSILHMSSIAVLLAWAELMLLLSRFPTWGYYALMFQAVLLNVLKVLLAFVCLVVGFAFSFAVQFHEQEGFRNPWWALVKTTVMMMGEFNYDDILMQDTRLPVTSRIIFVVFVVLAPIVLMNLMVGLAVSDIQALQMEGHTRRLLKQADFVAHLEKLSSRTVLRCRLFPQKLHRALDARRRIPTELTIQPMRAEFYMPGRLLDELVAVALRNHDREQRLHKNSEEESLCSTNSLDSRTTRTLADTVANAGIVDALCDLQRQMADIRRLLQMDRAVVSTSFQTSMKKKISSTQRPRTRFSEAVIGLRGTNGVLKNLRRTMSHADA